MEIALVIFNVCFSGFTYLGLGFRCPANFDVVE